MLFILKLFSDSGCKNIIVRKVQITVELFLRIKSITLLIDFSPEIWRLMLQGEEPNIHSDSCNYKLLVRIKNREAKW